jgi:hypothetical protein
MRLLICLLLLLSCLCWIGCTTNETTSCNCDDDAVDDDTTDDDTTDDDATDDDAQPTPVVSAPQIIVPADNLPPEVVDQHANNNLDIVEHEGRLFFAFRTAPTHFASRKATMYVLSTVDQKTWDFEASFNEDKDVRECRFLSWNGRLFLYFAVLGTNPFAFEPGGMMVSERLGPGDWTKEQYFYGEGFIPWRTKVIDDTPYMLTYVGGAAIYSLHPKPIEVHWLTTTDGYNWEAVVPGQPVVLLGGASETDFVFLDDGSLIAVARNEDGDASGFGSKICRAAADDLGHWQCVNDRRKYDSPLLFRHGSHIYLIGRRNVTADGYYDLGYDTLAPALQHLIYELAFWIAPKRTSLWEVNPDTLEVSFVLDLPSRGDTSFAGRVPLSDDTDLIYNYTSPLDGPDYFWLWGQLHPTEIYAVTFTYPK